MQKLDMTLSGPAIPHVPDTSPTMQLVRSMIRGGVACSDRAFVDLMLEIEEKFEGNLQAAASAVAAGVVTFEPTTSGERWRMLQGRAAR
jgi:hypothetical protein